MALSTVERPLSAKVAGLKCFWQLIEIYYPTLTASGPLDTVLFVRFDVANRTTGHTRINEIEIEELERIAQCAKGTIANLIATLRAELRWPVVLMLSEQDDHIVVVFGDDQAKQDSRFYQFPPLQFTGELPGLSANQ